MNPLSTVEQPFWRNVWTQLALTALATLTVLLLTPAANAATIHPYGFGGPSSFAMSTAGGVTGNGMSHLAVTNTTLTPATTQISGGAGIQSSSASHTVIPGNSAVSQSSASFGVVKLGATFSDANGSGFVNHAGGIVDAGWLDLYTISDPLFNGQNGVLTFLIHAEGLLTSSGWAASGWSLSASTNTAFLDFITQESCDSRLAPPCSLTINSDYSISVPFVFGLSFEMLVRSLASTGVASGTPFGTPASSGPASGSFDLLNTIYWAGIESVTVGGTPVSGYTISAAPGVDYTQSFEQSSAVPEPGSLTMVALAVAAVAWAARSRLRAPIR